jgi:hypothetical protein
VTGSHIYTLNNNIKSLKQTHNNVKKINLKAGSNYRVNEKKPQVVYKMIDNEDDILSILKSKPEEDVNLILRNNDLVGLVYELRSIGYTPAIEYKAGKISAMWLQLNDTKFFC